MQTARCIKFTFLYRNVDMEREREINMSSLRTFFTFACDNEGRFSGEGGRADHEGS